MESDTPPDFLSSALVFLNGLWESIVVRVFSMSFLYEVGAIVAAFVLAFILAMVLKPFCTRITEAIEERDDWIEGVVDWISDNLFRLLLAVFLWTASIGLDAYRDHGGGVVILDPDVASAIVTGEESGSITISQAPVDDSEPVTVQRNFLLVRAVASLATLILFSGALPARLRATISFKVLFFALAVALALNLVGLWVPVRDSLGEIKLLPLSESSETRVTILSLFKGLLAIVLLIPLCRWLLRILDHRIGTLDNVSPVLRVLISKFITVLVVILAVLFGISSLGVNLSALAVLGGAVGLGLGFGFQKVVSNLISGVILLTDRSIKPGDVIEVDETYGWINKLSARYVSVITRDGTEHLIPNETLITDKVTNWSFSNDDVRVKIPFGVSYDSDVHQVMALAIEAAKENSRVLKHKEPVCWLTGFGDNSVDFELRIWIRDPAKGVVNLKSAIYVRLWDLFKEHKIEIPFPQRDLHIRGSVPVELKKPKEDS